MFVNNQNQMGIKQPLEAKVAGFNPQFKPAVYQQPKDVQMQWQSPGVDIAVPAPQYNYNGVDVVTTTTTTTVSYPTYIPTPVVYAPPAPQLPEGTKVSIEYPPIDLHETHPNLEMKVEKEKVQHFPVPRPVAAKPAAPVQVLPRQRDYKVQNSWSPIVAFALAVMFTAVMMSVALPAMTLILIPSALVLSTGGVFHVAIFHSRV